MSCLRVLACAALMSSFLLCAPSRAGPYADEMAKCMVKSSTPADRAVFIRFIFVAIAQHPDVQSLVRIPQHQIEDSAKVTAALVQRLMLESCRGETQLALRYEGPQTVVYAFQIFGQAAGAELYSNPRVADVMNHMGKYLDVDKIKNLTNANPSGGGAGSAASTPQPAAPVPQPAASADPK